jgi:hypothetical protein
MQRAQTALWQGVDGAVKTLYSPPPSLKRATVFFFFIKVLSQRFIVKRSIAKHNATPAMGGAAFAHAAYAAHSMLASRPSRQLAGCEDRTHPGEGSA